MVFPPVLSINLPNSLTFVYKSRQTGTSVVISTMALLPLLKSRGLLVLTATSPVDLSRRPNSFFTEAATCTEP